MRHGQVFRLTMATLGISSPEGEQRIPVMIPSGATLRVVSVDASDDRFVYVTWKDKALAVFVTDLISRGRRANAAGA